MVNLTGQIPPSLTDETDDITVEEEQSPPERMSVGFQDPAVVDPTTGKPYSPSGLMRQQKEQTRQAEAVDSFNELKLKKDLQQDIEAVLNEEIDDKPQDRSSSPRPMLRPKPKRTSPIDKVLELNYLLKEKSSLGNKLRRKKSKVIPGLDALNEDHQKTIKGFFDSAVGGDSGFDPLKTAWCAAFVSHILEELGADPLKSGDRYDRLRADKFKNYGSHVQPDDIQEGDIVVFDFDADGKGDHVTFYAGNRITSQDDTDQGFINVLGGNHSGQVSIREGHPLYVWGNVAAVRRITYDDIDFEFTKEMAEQDPVFNEFMPEYANSSEETTQTFNEGGAVMQRQMELAFMNEGGLKDDGLEKDPVSGNEIPDGSMAEEVRDDIPAQLSEGEYVVPADVVRFYGVKFFEDLRMEAKRGLAEMEANGRIGGEPVPAGGPQANEASITDQEMSALRELAMEMNQGGSVPNMQPAPRPMGNTTQQQQPQMMNKGGTVLGFQAAGDTGTTQGAVTSVQGAQAAQSSVPGGTGLGFSLFGSGSEIQNMTGTGDMSQTGSTTTDDRDQFEEGQEVYLYKDNQTMTFMMMADYDDYKQKLSEGWSTEQVLEDPEITDPTITPVKEDDGGSPPPPNKETKPAKSPSEMTDKELVDSLNSMGTIARAGSSLAISMGLPVGAIVSAGLVNQYNNLLAEADSRGKLPEGAKRRGSIFGGEGSLTENLYQIDDDGNIVEGTAGQGDFSDTWLGDLLGFDGEAGVQGPGLRDSIGGGRRYQGTATEGSSTTDITTTNNDRDSSPRPVETPAVKNLVREGNRDNSNIGKDAGAGMTWVKDPTGNSNAIVRVRSDSVAAKGQKAAMEGFDE